MTEHDEDETMEIDDDENEDDEESLTIERDDYATTEFIDQEAAKVAEEILDDVDDILEEGPIDWNDVCRKAPELKPLLQEAGFYDKDRIHDDENVFIGAIQGHFDDKLAVRREEAIQKEKVENAKLLSPVIDTMKTWLNDKETPIDVRIHRLMDLADEVPDIVNTINYTDLTEFNTLARQLVQGFLAEEDFGLEQVELMFGAESWPLVYPFLEWLRDHPLLPVWHDLCLEWWQHYVDRYLRLALQERHRIISDSWSLRNEYKRLVIPEMKRCFPELPMSSYEDVGPPYEDKTSLLTYEPNLLRRSLYILIIDRELDLYRSLGNVLEKLLEPG